MQHLKGNIANSRYSANVMRSQIDQLKTIINGSQGVLTGIVFTPTIDERKILSWENNAGLQNPKPVDLNPFDEWVDDDAQTEYVWEDDE